MTLLHNIASALQAFGLVFGLRTGVEEPRYTLRATLCATLGPAPSAASGQVQIREYAPRLAASVTVPGAEISARSTGFRLLAAYIFGANTANSSIAPSAPASQSAEIAMTAPVLQAPAENGLWQISFFLPAKYTLATLPHPTNPGIRIMQLPASTQAVYRFSGLPSAAAVARAQKLLQKNLAGSAWVEAGPLMAQFYDPPWTLPWLRRNEIAVLVTPRA